MKKNKNFSTLFTDGRISRDPVLLIGEVLFVMLSIIIQLNLVYGADQKVTHNGQEFINEVKKNLYKSISATSKSTVEPSYDIKNKSYVNATSLSVNPGHSEKPEIVTSGEYVYVLWLDDSNGNRDVFFKRSIDYGKTFERTLNLSNRPGGAINPSIVVSDNSQNVNVIWEHIPGNNGEILFTKSIDKGATFDAPINIGNNSGLNGFPHIAVSENNVIFTLWHDTVNGIVLRKSTDSGESFAQPTTLSDKNVDALNPHMAVSKNNIYVTWQSNSQLKNGEILFVKSTDSGISFTDPTSISKIYKKDKKIVDSEEQNENVSREYDNFLAFNPRIGFLSGTDQVYVAWYTGFSVRSQSHYFLLMDIFFTRSTDSGTTFETPVSLTDDSGWPKNTDNGAPFETPVSLTDYSGWAITPQMAVSKNNIYVTWQSNPQGKNGEIVFVKSTDNGSSFESPIVLSGSAGDSVDPKMVISQNNSMSWVWSNNASGNEEVYFLNVDNKGQAINPQFYAQKDTQLHNDTVADISEKSKNIGLIQRTFTDAAYDNAFYLFYNMKHNNSTNNTKYTNLLSSKIIKQHLILPEFEVILDHLKWFTPKSKITLITDEDAHDASSLFLDNGTNKYDLIIVGHNEYVTQQEYNNLKSFVAKGGTLILLDGNVFYAEVKYNKENQTITLVKGHGWEFDGTSANRSVTERWAKETTKWVGSNFCKCFTDDIKFGNNPFGVRHNEEQNVTNDDAKIILNYEPYDYDENKPNANNLTIATYELDYKKGRVITFGLYTDDLLFKNDKFKRFFDSLLLYYVFGDNK